jgi:hypothetical protein
MLRFKFMSQVLAAGVVQFASTFGLSSVTAAFSEPLAFAQDVCTPGDEASGNPDVPAAEGWACGEHLPNLDLTVPANGAAALSTKAKDKTAKLPDEAAASAPLPLEITPSQAGASARASLQSLRNFQNQKQGIKVQEANKATGGTLAVPKMAATPPGPLDLWTRLDAQGFDGSDGRSVKSGAGLDYRVVKNASIGVAAERAETLAGSSAPRGTAEDKVSAYVAFRALPALTIDARGNWSSTQVADPLAAEQGEKASVAVAPRFAKSYALDGGETLVPYVEVKHEIDLGGSVLGAEAPGASNSAAAGVTLAKPESYSVSVSADVTSTDPKEAPSLSSKVQLKVPLD